MQLKRFEPKFTTKQLINQQISRELYLFVEKIKNPLIESEAHNLKKRDTHTCSILHLR